MFAAADRDPFCIEEAGHVLREDELAVVVYVECDDAAAGILVVDLYLVHSFDLFKEVVFELDLVLMDLFLADRIDVLHGCCHAEGSFDRLGATRT